jgi:hypothetical protein
VAHLRLGPRSVNTASPQSIVNASAAPGASPTDSKAIADTRSRRLQILAIAIMTLVISIQVLQAWKGSNNPALRYASVAGDFRDFYCAGATLNAGEDPYLAEPLSRCGSAVGARLPSDVQGLTTPAPLPPYALAIFRLFAKMPFIAAALLFSALSIFALTYSVIRLASITRCPPIAIFAAFAMPLYLTVVEWGNLPCILIGLLVAAAYALKKKAYVAAGFACVATLIEPNLGLPTCLAVFLWAPGTRRSIAAGVAGIGLLSLLTAGLHGNIEYLAKVIPAQAQAEVPAQMQYSFTWLAHVVGLPDGVALRIGSISYAVMAGLGVWFAREIARAKDADEFLPIVPAAFAVFGGSYIHLFQTSISIVLGIILLGVSQRRSPLLLFGIGLQIVIWWTQVWLVRPYTLARFESALAIAVFCFFAGGFRAFSTRIALSLAASFTYLLLSFAILHAPRQPVCSSEPAAAYAKAIGSDLQYASGEWGRFLRNTPIETECDVMVIAEKIPIWLGAFLLIVFTITQSRGPNEAAGSRLERRRYPLA